MILSANSLVPQRVNTLTLTCLVFLFCFDSIFFLLERHAQNNHGEFQKSGTNAAEQNWCVALLIDFNLARSSGREHSWRWRWAETSQAAKSAVVTLLHKGSAKSGTELGKWLKLNQTWVIQVIHKHSVLFPGAEDLLKSTDLSICWRFDRFKSITLVLYVYFTNCVFEKKKQLKKKNCPETRIRCFQMSFSSVCELFLRKVEEREFALKKLNVWHYMFDGWAFLRVGIAGQSSTGGCSRPRGEGHTRREPRGEMTHPIDTKLTILVLPYIAQILPLNF